MTTARSAAKESLESPRNGVKTLAGFTIAHGIFHFMQQSRVMLPAIKETFGISAIQIGALMTAKEIAMGLSSLPGGHLHLCDRSAAHDILAHLVIPAL